MQRARLLDLLVIIALAAVLTVVAPAGAEEPAAALANPAADEPSPEPPGPRVVEADGERYITMDFQDVDLAILVKFMGEITGKNFVMDDRVQGKVSVVSPSKITPEEAYQVFQAVLQVKGFTTVPSGAAIRIIPTKDAKETSLRTLTDDGGRVPNEEYVTRLIRLRQVDAADIGAVLQPLVSKDGLISSYPQTNSLIVIDSAANIERLLQMIAELDVARSRKQTALIKLKHATASELAETIQQVLEERLTQPGQPQQPGRPAFAPSQLRAFKITPDDRTNTLIVNAATEQMQQIKKLAKRLDVPLPPGSGRINVYYLKYANAEDMLPVLLDVIGASGAAGWQARPQPQPGQDRSRRRSLGSSLRRSFTERARRQPGARAQPGGQTGQQPIEFASDIRITADPSTNALIITAAPEDYLTLLGVIEQLDVRRRQVYVEAIILEVTLDRLRQLGIESQGGVGLPDGVGLGRFNVSDLNTALSNPASLSGLIMAAASDRTVTLPDGTKVPAQVVLLTALQRDSAINILSAPNILTMDNEEAEIIVGQNVPFVASRSTSETNLSNVFQTVEREDVGITLRLTPQISEGSIVRLALFEEVSAIVPNPVLDANTVGPTTTVRSASTTITVKDGQTVVIGGLISDSITASESKIPFISDIPVLGNLFKNTETTKTKINLLIFLTPHIIKDEGDAEAVSTSERDRFRSLVNESRTPKRVPDPLDKPSFELQQEPARGLEGKAAAEPSTLALGDVNIDRRTDGAVIRLVVRGNPVRFTHEALEHPGRYVIDVFGPTQAEETVETIPVIDPLLRQVTVEHRRDRMRLILGLTTDSPPAYVLEQYGANITIKLGAARAPATDAPPEP